MDLNKEAQQRKEFCDILFELAKSQEKLQDAYYRSMMYKRLENLYDAPSPDKHFRHFYSDIFSVLRQLQQNPSQLGDINILGQNLDMIRNGYQPNKNASDDGRLIDVSDDITNLYDHVNLDIARILYTDTGDWKISGEETFQNLQTQVNDIADHIYSVQQNAEKKINEVQSNAERKISNQQREYIAILGIFAAVVLAFTGGIAFSTSVLNNISQVSIYRIILITLMIGLVLINILFGLFFYIQKIVTEKEKILPLIISNTIILILIIITILAWNFGFVESRNKRISLTLEISNDVTEEAVAFTNENS